MKKHLFIGLVAMLALCLVGCESKEQQEFNKLTLDLHVDQADWQWDNDNLQFYYHFDVPEITWQIYDYGNWSISREYNYGTNDAYQVALPQSVYMVEEVEDEETHEKYNVYYTQHIDYAVGAGWVEIILTNSDYMYASDNPATMHFRLQLIY